MNSTLLSLQTIDNSSHMINRWENIGLCKESDNVKKDDADNQQGRKKTHSLKFLMSEISRSGLTKEVFELEYLRNLLIYEEISLKYCVSVDTVLELRRIYHIPVVYGRIFKKRAHLTFTPFEKSIIYGTVCGDGYIDVDDCGTCSLEVSHSDKQLDYLLWKSNSLKRWLSHKKPYRKYTIMGYTSRPQDNTKIYTSYEIQTFVAPIFNELRELFYPEGKKVISKPILDQLDELALAVWFGDDGSYAGSNQLVICGYWSPQEWNDISQWFSTRWNINVSIEDHSRYHKKIPTHDHKIVFNCWQAIALYEIIKPHLHPSLMYKLKSVHPPQRSYVELPPKDEDMIRPT